MKKIYIAANLPDAHIVLNMLQSENIEAHIFNQHAQSGMGEIPFTHAYPEVWLTQDSDISRAQDLINAYQSTPTRTNWRCLHCAEENPGNFELCWQCAKPKS